MTEECSNCGGTMHKKKFKDEAMRTKERWVCEDCGRKDPVW